MNIRRVYWSYMRQLWDDKTVEEDEEIRSKSKGNITGDTGIILDDDKNGYQNKEEKEEKNEKREGEEREEKEERESLSYHERCLAEDSLLDDILIEVTTINYN